MMYYSIQTIAFQVFFLFVYDVFLKKETFFNWNRVYLLSTAILSLILPFIKIDRFKEVMPKDYIVTLPEVVIGQLNEPISNSFLLNTIILENKISVLEIIFYLGFIMAFFIFLIKVIKMINFIFKNPKSYKGKLILVELKQSNTAFSFLNYIFLGELITPKEKETILKHELTHVNQKHTLDLLFFELLRIIFWFNPLVYMYQNKMMTLHEFIADAKAVKHQNKTEYYQNLLSQIFDTNTISFINPFFKQSLIKKRIIMLQKTKSKQVKLFKYALLIPLVLGMLVYTSSEAQESDSNNKVSENIEIPFSVIENVPIYPGCEHLETNSEKKKCMSENMNKFIGMNFNTKIAKEKSLNGRQRISVIFKINTEGNVVAIESRAPHPALEKEAIRVISSLPKMKPGAQRGKVVTVTYYMPIIFEVKNNGQSLDESNIAEVSTELIDDSLGIANTNEVAVFRGCEVLTIEEQKKCMSSQISTYMYQNFDTKIASKLGLKGKQRISVIFKINTEGNVVGIKSRAPHLELEKEAIRVIKSLPKMTPFKLKGVAVSVPYFLPIVFQVAD